MVVMSPPPTLSHARSAVKTVTFSNNNPVFIIPAEPTVGTSGPKHHPETLITPSPHASSTAAAGTEAAEAKDQPPTRSAAGGVEAHGGAPYGWSRPEVPAYSGSGHCYMPSPLPGWEDGERRRREYFGGEYSYYPTPVREGIYNIATDANRLTAMFSEENPNACSIV